MIFPLLIRFVFALAWTLIYISLSLRFSMVIQIAISESVSAIDTLKRSWKLTKGLVLSIFLVLFILGLINFFSQLALYQFVKPSSNVLYLSLSPIINLLLYPFTLIALVLYYFNVRAMREDLIIPTLEIDFAYRKRKKLDDVSKKESEKIRKNLKVNKKKIDKTPNKHSTKPPTKYPAKKKVEHIITKTEVFEEELAIGIITLDTPPLPDLTTNTDETTDITAYKSIELVDVKMENENPKSKIDTLKYNTVEIIDDKEKLEELKINKGKKFVVEDWKLIKLSTTTIENDGEIGETNDYGDINLSAKVSLAETTPSEIDDNVMGYGQVELSSYTEPEPSIPTIQETEKSIEILTPLEETPISDEFKLENVTDSLGDATKEESGFDFGGLDLAGVTPEVEGTPELEPIISEIEPVNIEKITSTPTIEISNDLGISSDFAPIDLDTPIEIPTKKTSSIETKSIDSEETKKKKDLLDIPELDTKSIPTLETEIPPILESQEITVPKEVIENLPSVDDDFAPLELPTITPIVEEKTKPPKEEIKSLPKVIKTPSTKEKKGIKIYAVVITDCEPANKKKLILLLAKSLKLTPQQMLKKFKLPLTVLKTKDKEKALRIGKTLKKAGAKITIKVLKKT